MTISNITLYYFNFGTIGVGEIIKLFLEDAAVPHDYIRIDMREKWPSYKKELINDGNGPGCVPFIQINGADKKYFGSVAILRMLSKRLGKYISSDEDEEQFLDACSGLASDWYTAVITVVKYPWDKAIAEEYANVHAPKHFARFERFYGAKEGPYLLGSDITYVDFIVYHTLEEQHRTKNLQEFPALAAFVEGFEARPNISKYHASMR